MTIDPSSEQDAPPVSLTAVWDRAKWHSEFEHIAVVFAFLAERKMLTDDGLAAFEEGGEALSLSREEVLPAAHGFLDETYGEYVDAPTDATAMRVLVAGWKSYVARFDLKKEPRPNAYQSLILELGGPRHRLLNVLREMRRNPDVTRRLRGAVSYVPGEHRALVDMALAASDSEDLTALAEETDAALSLLTALSAMRVSRLDAFAAALVLARRLDVRRNVEPLSLCVSVFNTAAASDLSLEEREAAATLANALFAVGGEHRHTAMCAMRHVGNGESLRLILETPPEETEGWRGKLPAWDRLRQEAAAKIRARLSST